ncbi:MAG: hypothetical protein AAF663_00470 [Planctomycetota bacterium]
MPAPAGYSYLAHLTGTATVDFTLDTDTLGLTDDDFPPQGHYDAVEFMRRPSVDPKRAAKVLGVSLEEAAEQARRFDQMVEHLRDRLGDDAMRAYAPDLLSLQRWGRPAA